MTDLALLLQAPNRDWANHVESLIKGALDGRGSVNVGVLGEDLGDAHPAHACFVTGVAACELPEDAALSLVTSALRGLDVEQRRLDSGLMQLVVRPW